MNTITANTNQNSSLARIANAPSITHPKTNFEIVLPQYELSEAFKKQPLKRRGWIAKIVFLLFIGLIMGIGWSRPSVEWDLLAYIGSALSLDNSNIIAVHDASYAAAKKYLPAEKYEGLTTRPEIPAAVEYTEDMTTNPEHFAEQFQYYKIKPLYIFTLYLLMKTGLDPVHADILISCLSCGLISLIVRNWLRKFLRAGMAEIVAIALLILAGIFDFAGMTTPDALSSLTVVAAFYTIAMNKNQWLTIAAFFAAMLVRIDNAPLILMYLFYAKFIAANKISWEKAIGTGLVVVATFFGVKEWTGFYGWHVHFYHTFIQRLIDPAHFTGSVSIAQYVSTIIFALRMKPPCNLNWCFIALGIAGTMLGRPGSLERNILFQLTCLAGIAAIVHFIIFPGPAPRFYFGYYLTTGIFFIDEVRRVKSTAWRRKSFTEKNFAHAI